MEKKTEPKLRFSEFKDDWKEYALENVTTKIQDGTHFSPNAKDVGEYLYLTAKNVKNGYLDLDNVQYIDEKEHKEIYKRCDVKKNDVLITKDGTIGQCCINPLEEEISLLSSVAFIRSNTQNDNYFIYLLISSEIGQREIQKSIAGQALKRITLTKIRNYRFNVPPIKEQQKIASFLSAVDKKIEQLTRKKELLEEYKKGVMQKLFSYDLRLGKSDLRKGKLGDFGYFYYGKGAPKPTIQPHGKTPCVRYGELYSTYGDEIKKVKSKTIVSPEELKLSTGGEVLVPRVGEDPKDFANCSYLPFKDVAIGEMISVYNTEEDGLFMTYYINATKSKELAKRVEGGNVSNLYYKYVEEIDIEIPSIEEQRTIVNFVKAIDFKIESLGLQIQKTQTFKKGLLQQMFV